MKKRDCAIVQDLLVLYEDDMLQEESRQMVEEHIRSCEECMHIYETTSAKLPIKENKETESEKLQDDSAVRVMKKLKRRITHKSVVALGIVLVVILVIIVTANEICARITGNDAGIAGMLYTVPSDDIEVAELYQLKNGDIYCTLESDENIWLQTTSDMIVPDGAYEKDTDQGYYEITFRKPSFWKEKDVPVNHQFSAVFLSDRQGELVKTKKKVTHRCEEIFYCGKTKNDKKTLWKRGEKVQEAPEEIERKAIREYIFDNQIEKAIEECENLGWDSKEIIKVFQKDQDDIYINGYSNIYSGAGGEKVEFSNRSDVILVAE